MNKIGKISHIFLCFVLLVCICFGGCTKDVNGPTPSEPTSSENDVSEVESNVEKEDDSAMYEGKTRIKVLSYNIRCLRGGESGAGYEPLTESQTAETIKNFSDFLDREDPDIFIVCENRMFFDAKATAADGAPKTFTTIFSRDISVTDIILNRARLFREYIQNISSSLKNTLM